MTALCIAGFLSLIATSFQPKKQVAAASIPTGCIPSHCHAKISGRQVVATKLQ
ncbi:hypothetical protein [Bradyrhizobium sp.]|uniref:hypothetical protein n=1 Tax=Bradyrhizobium sp. TaxID=376 RepID=UPI002620FD50|nr:hypothetical protein [Bradyrhizobium sp.]